MAARLYLNLIFDIQTSLYTFFHPTVDTFLSPSLSFTTRLRLLCYQPLALLLYSLKSVHKLSFRDPGYVVRYIPTRNPQSLRRCLVYNDPTARGFDSSQRHRPLHVDIHPGAFIGGLPEANREFCLQVARCSGAVVVSVSYRFAPRYPFPAAIDDIDDILAWLIPNAETVLCADPKLLTVSGISAGGNLALAASYGMARTQNGETQIKGAVTFYAPIDLRIPPQGKPKPHGFPKWDPMSWMIPLFDAYAAPARVRAKEDPRLNPILAPLECIPHDVLMIIPGIDILVQEQQSYIKRVQSEIETASEQKDVASSGRKIEALCLEKAFHGWLELPSAIVGDTDKATAFDAACKFIQSVHEKHGYAVSTHNANINLN